MSTTIDYFIGQVLYRVEDVVRIGMHDRHGHPHVTLRTFYVDSVDVGLAALTARLNAGR